MDIWGAIVVLARRFYLTVPLAALLLLGAYFITSSTPAEYHASTSVALLGPKAPQNDKAAPPPYNPYANMSMASVTTTLQIDLTSPQSLAQLAAAQNSTNFTITNLGKTNILSLNTTSSSAQQAISTANQLATMVATDMVTRQAQYTTDPTQQATIQILAPAQLATADTKARTRAEAIAMGAAVLVTILLVLLIDAILESRRRRLAAADPDLALAPEKTPNKPRRTPVVRS